MVYDSDFYTTRRTYSRPAVTSYTVTTPRYYLATEAPGTHRSIGKDYSYKYSSTNESRVNSNDPYSYSRPERTSYSSTVERTSRSGPGGDYNYSSERSSKIGSGPGSFSYSSTASGRLPGGTTYRHWSYRV